MSDTLGSLLREASSSLKKSTPSFLLEAYDRSLNLDVPCKDYLLRIGYPMKAFDFLPKDEEICLYQPHEVPMKIMFDGFTETRTWGTMIGQYWHEWDDDPQTDTYIDLVLFISKDGNSILVSKAEKDSDGIYRLIATENTKWKDWAPIAVLPPALFWACRFLIFEPKCDLPL